MITFEVPGVPKGKPRPKFARGRTYTPGCKRPKACRCYECTIVAYALVIRPQWRPFAAPGEPVEVAITFYLPRPLDRFRKIDDPGPTLCPVKPDIDNLVKAVLDALGRSILDGDQQVVRVVAEKRRVAIRDRKTKTGDKPTTVICVKKL